VSNNSKIKQDGVLVTLADQW